MRAHRRRVTPKERSYVYGLCNGHCAYCGKAITLREMQVDHFLSMETGPAIAYGRGEIDSLDNYLPACRSCNYRKSTMTVEQFRMNVSRLHDVLMRDSVTYRDAVRFGQVTPAQHIQLFYYEKLGVKIPSMDWAADFLDMLHKSMFRGGDERKEE